MLSINKPPEKSVEGLIVISFSQADVNMINKIKIAFEDFIAFQNLKL
jgi:hypothetical protein